MTIPHKVLTVYPQIKNIFSNASHRPKGKIILSYRKEYNPEIEDLCKKLEIPREKIFLKKYYPQKKL